MFGDGSTRSTAQCEAFFTQLGGARVLGDQERNPDLAWEEDPITDGTDTWEIRKQLIAKAPTHDAWTTMLAALKPMGRATVQTTRSLAFVHEYEWEWKQTGVSAVSSSWHPFATPELRDLGTSYAWSGIVVLHVDASGAPSTDLMETDSEGAGTGAGGGATTVTPLTYFENHAYHEFGHSVGEATFQGMASGSGRGNTDALTYGGWATESASTFSAAMFTRTTPGEVTYTPSGAAAPTTVQLDPSDVTDYCVQLLSRGTEPGASNKLAALPGTDIAGRIAMLQASDDFKNEQMVQYVAAVYAQAGIDMPDNAFQFTGFTPSGTSTYIYASRYNGDFASYDTDAYTKVKDSTGWYALSSPAEMFAEIYTTHYADDSRPAARAGVDWQVFFDELEASPGAAALAGGAQAAPTGPTNSPAGSGEKEPAVGLLP